MVTEISWKRAEIIFFVYARKSSTKKNSKKISDKMFAVAKQFIKTNLFLCYIKG